MAEFLLKHTGIPDGLQRNTFKEVLSAAIMISIPLRCVVDISREAEEVVSCDQVRLQ